MMSKTDNMPTDSKTLDLRRGNTQWSAKEKIKRGAWNVCQTLLFRPTPKRMGNSWRLWLLRAFGAKIVGASLILPSCKILAPWNLEIHDGSTVGDRVDIYNYDKIVIGSMTIISQDTFLCTGTHDYTHPYLPLIWKPINIGSECWISAGAFIGPGVSIGDGTVVGARSVVVKDLPPWTVCAGNPCKALKPRVVKPVSD